MLNVEAYRHADRPLRGAGQSMGQVILGRVISGSGGAGIIALAAVIITGEYIPSFFAIR